MLCPHSSDSGKLWWHPAERDRPLPPLEEEAISTRSLVAISGASRGGRDQAPGAGKEGAWVDQQGGLTYQSIKGNEEILSSSSALHWLRAREELEAERFPLETPGTQSHNALASISFVCSSMT